MRILIALLALCCFVSSALIGTTIYSLSRFFQYKIEITSKYGNIVEFATITPKINGCVLGRCFYGWISNYTIGNETAQGYNQQSQSKNFIFFSQLLQNATLRLTSNNQLELIAKTLVDITAQLLTPLPFVFSNSGSRNDSQIYNFVPFDNMTNNEMIDAQLNPQNFDFSQVIDSLQTSSNYVGWRISSPVSDVMLYDKALNSLLFRKMILADDIQVKIQMINKSFFGDLIQYGQMISDISNTIGNMVDITIDDSSLFPEMEISSLFA